MTEDIHQELKAWGHPGGDGSMLIIKSDGESPIVAVREAVSRRHGGIITQSSHLEGSMRLTEE